MHVVSLCVKVYGEHISLEKLVIYLVSTPKRTIYSFNLQTLTNLMRKCCMKSFNRVINGHGKNGIGKFSVFFKNLHL